MASPKPKATAPEVSAGAAPAPALGGGPADYDDIARECVAYLRGVVNDPKATISRRDRAAERLLGVVARGAGSLPDGVKSQRKKAAEKTINAGRSKFTPAQAPNGHAAAN